MKKSVRIGLVVASVAALTSVTVGGAQVVSAAQNDHSAAVQAGSDLSFIIKPKRGLLLDADPATVHDNFGTVWQMSQNGTDAQRWYFYDDYSIRPKSDTNMCLDADPDTNYDGGLVYLYHCEGTPQQHWYLTSDNGFKNGFSGRCLDADIHSIRNRGKIQEWSCNSQDQQTWGWFHN